MKKFFAVIILAATLLSLLAGCSGEAEETPTTPKSGISVEEVLDNLEEMLVPIADQFKLTLGREIELESGSICQRAIIEDTILADSYDILIYYTQAEDVSMVALTADRGTYSNLDFALFSYYLYKSLNLSEMEAEAFYEEFNLLTTEPEGVLRTEGWFVSVTPFDSFLNFAVSYSPDYTD